MAISKREDVLQYMQSVHISKGAQLREHINVSRSYLNNLVENGDLIKVGKGLYALASAEPSIYRSYAEVVTAVPDAVIALVSALSFHDIGTQLPWAVWAAFPRQSRSYVPISLDTPIEMIRMDEKLLYDGAEEHIIEGVHVRIHSVEKALADSFKYLGRVGLNVALESLKDAWGKNKIDMDKLHEYAVRDHVWTKMKPYIEMVQQP